MGLWSFIKDTGKSLMPGKAEASPAPEVIEKEIADLGLEASGVEVAVQGDKVVVKGNAPSQEQREKIILAAGNIEGVAEVEEQIDVPDASDPVFHEVAKGDNLWKIAEKHYGNGAKYTEIFEANKPMLSDPDKIYPGQKLRIPQL